MKFLLIMQEGSGEDWTKKPVEVLQPIIEAHQRFSDELRSRGQYLGGEALRPSSEARTIRLQGEEMFVTDGPFIETKEQIAGFYMIEAADFEEATEWGKKLTSFDGGPIEVRPVIDI